MLGRLTAYKLYGVGCWAPYSLPSRVSHGVRIGRAQMKCHELREDNHHFRHETRDVQEDKKHPNSIVDRRMRERREALGLAQEKVGVGISLDESSARPRISRYELGVHEAPVPTAKQIASALEVSLAYLYCEDDGTAKLLEELHKLNVKHRTSWTQTFLAELVGLQLYE
jgi:transcriptional regulator with XRE-family HTH domain